MEMFVEISFYVVVMILIIFMVMLIIITNRNLYCAIYYHKDRKLWKYLITNAFQFKQTYETEKSIWFEWDGYELFVWKNDELISVHKNDECVLSHFDKKMSKQMYNTLKELGKI